MLKKVFEYFRGMNILIFLAALILIVYFVSDSGEKTNLLKNENLRGQSNGIIMIPETDSINTENKIKQNYQSEKKVLDKPLLKPDSLNKKVIKNVMEQWLEAGSKIADKTKLVEASDIMDFLDEKVVISKPGIAGAEPYDSVIKPFIGFVVMDTAGPFPSDFWYGPADKEQLGINCFVLNKNIILTTKHRSGVISETMKGLLMLFNGTIALEYYKDPPGLNKEEGRKKSISALLKAHEVKNKLMTNIGGKLYDSLLAAEVNRIGLLMDSNSTGLKMFFPGPENYSVELYRLFSASTLYETEKIKVYFHAHATFTVLERGLKKDLLDLAKREFIKIIYF